MEKGTDPGNSFPAGRRKAFFCLLLAVAGVILLAVGLPEMQLQPGLPIPGAAGEPGAGASAAPLASPPQRAPVGWLLQGTLAIGVVGLLALLLVGLIRKASGKRLLQTAAALAVVLALLLLLPQVAPAPAANAPEETAVETLPPDTFSIAPIGDPPAGLYRFVTAFLLLGGLAAGVWLLLRIRPDWLRKPREPENRLAAETAAALQAIASGQDLKNVIIRCYLNMATLLKEEQGLEREQSVTVREFERWLALQGLPDGPIHQLTGLFEQARYGRRPPDRQDEEAAVDCLSAIERYCRQHAKAVE